MFTLIQNAEIYSPDPMGVQDVLIAGEKIAAVGESLPPPPERYGLDRLDLSGHRLTPGLIDAHCHPAGAGGGSGPPSRGPELHLGEMFRAGITTIVGLVGLDASTRHLTSLLAKCRALRAEGGSAYMMVGAYQVPPPTLTGSLRQDVVLIPEVLGVGEIAISDTRSSHPSAAELARIASESKMGGAIGGKAGLVNIHVGPGKGKLRLLFEAAERYDVALADFLPTHVNRTQPLLEDALAYNLAGGAVDLTSGVGLELKDGLAQRASRGVAWLLERGADPARVSMSTDAKGVYPIRNEGGAVRGYHCWSNTSLLHEMRALVQESGLRLEEALPLVTTNVARLYGLGCKGRIAPGADADLMAFDEGLNLHEVFARGKRVLAGGKPIVRGYFESQPES